MREPKTPLPWDASYGVIFAGGEKWNIGSFRDGQDARYAVHAANVLPEVLAALRDAHDLAARRQAEALAASLPGPYSDWQEMRVLLSMALAKAEGAGEASGG
jgi:hypothetical protein